MGAGLEPGSAEVFLEPWSMGADQASVSIGVGLDPVLKQAWTLGPVEP